MEFKDRLKKLRAEKGTSATQLAHHLDKGESAVRMWESGRNKPDADTLVTMAKYFDCSTDFLLGLSNNKKEMPREELMENIVNARFDRNDPEIQQILSDEKFYGFVTDLIIALHKNNKTGGIADLYTLFDAILKDKNEDPTGNTFRVWRTSLTYTGLIVKGILKLEDLGESKRAEQVIGHIRDLIHASYHCHRINDAPPDEKFKYPDV